MLRKTGLIGIVILLTSVVNNALQAEQPSSEVIKVGEAYAQSFCGGRIDSGVPYYGPGKGDIVWVFTAYKKSDTFPTEAEIRAVVAQARAKRLQAEADFAYYR